MTIEQMQERKTALERAHYHYYGAFLGIRTRTRKGPELWLVREINKYAAALWNARHGYPAPASPQTAADVQARRLESETRRNDDEDNAPRRQHPEGY